MGAHTTRALKMTDMKMTDQIAGHENAGHENTGHECQDMKLQDMTNISLLSFLPIPVILAVLWEI